MAPKPILSFFKTTSKQRLENIGLDNILEVHEDAQGEEVSLV